MSTNKAKYSVLSVANPLLTMAREQNISDISPMKLQKLLYFAHAWHLALFDCPLFREGIEAWEWGPVVPKIYSAFRKFGNSPIEEDAKEFTWENGELRIKSPYIEDDDFEVKDLLQEILRVYGDLTAIQLLNITHAEGTPWSIIASEYHSYLPKGLAIPNELIKDIFKKMLSAEVQPVDV